MKKIFIFTLFFSILCTSIYSCKRISGNSVITDEKNSNSLSSYEETDKEPSRYGDNAEDFYGKYAFEFYGVPAFLVEENIENSDFDKWSEQFEHVNPKGTIDGFECNILNFIKEFKIPEKAFEGSHFTNEQVEALYCSDEKEQVDLLFAAFPNKYAFLHNHKVYTPEWLDTHTAEDYEKEGIPTEKIEKAVESWGKTFGEKVQSSIKKEVEQYKSKLAKS